MTESKHKCVFCGKPYERTMYVKYDLYRGRWAEGQTKPRVKRVTVMCQYDCSK